MMKNVLFLTETLAFMVDSIVLGWGGGGGWSADCQ